MKCFNCLHALLVSFTCLAAHNTNTRPSPLWTWMGGSSNGSIENVFYNASVAYPGSRRGPSWWSDGSGYTLMFGGEQHHNELWLYEMVTNTWSVIPTDIGGRRPEAQRYAVLCGSSRTKTIVLMSGVNTRASLIGRMWQMGRNESVWSEMTDLNSEALDRWMPQSWCDSDAGVLYLFGGYVIDSNDHLEHYPGDMWMFDIDKHRFEEIRFDGRPTPRYHGTTWIDMKSRSLWLMGGRHSNGLMNDLWRFDINKKLWEEIRSLEEKTGMYGEKGVGSASTHPGARIGAFRWLDECGNLWLFGGSGYGVPPEPPIRFAEPGLLNDLWMYQRDRNVWVWLGGEMHEEGVGTYGHLMVSSPDYVPGPRADGASWSTGNMAFLFGGSGHNIDGDDTIMNDLWRLDMSGQCDWMATTESSNSMNAGFKPTTETVSNLVTIEARGLTEVPDDEASKSDADRSTMASFVGSDNKQMVDTTSGSSSAITSANTAAPTGKHRVAAIATGHVGISTESHTTVEQNSQIEVKPNVASNTALPIIKGEEPTDELSSVTWVETGVERIGLLSHEKTKMTGSPSGHQVIVNTLVDTDAHGEDELIEQATGVVVNLVTEKPTASTASKSITELNRHESKAATEGESIVEDGYKVLSQMDDEWGHPRVSATQRHEATTAQSVSQSVSQSAQSTRKGIDSESRFWMTSEVKSFENKGGTQAANTPAAQTTGIPIVKSTENGIRNDDSKKPKLKNMDKIDITESMEIVDVTSQSPTQAVTTQMPERSRVTTHGSVDGDSTTAMKVKESENRETETIGFRTGHTMTMKPTEMTTNKITITATNANKFRKPPVATNFELPDWSYDYHTRPVVKVFDKPKFESSPPSVAKEPQLPDESNLHLPHSTVKSSSSGWFGSREAAPFITIGLVLFVVVLFVVGILMAKPCFARKPRNRRYNYQKVASDDVTEWQL